MKEAKVVILGGGCAALSLANRLAQPGCNIEVVVIEPRPRYTDDRTWSFWGGQRTLPHTLPLHSWHKVGVSDPSRSICLDLSDQPYQMLRSLDFYQHSVGCISSSGSVSLLLDTSAISCNRLPSGRWQTETSGGPIVSDYVVDTRPRARDAIRPVMWQSFLGREIECAAAVFDPDVARLMDFQLPSAREVPFLYVLPTSSTRALIEITVLSKSRLPAGKLISRLEDAIAKQCGGHSHEVLREEYGAIPMGISRPEPLEPGYVYAGVTSGSARASSGYTFCRIQHWADACAKSLLAGGSPVGPLPDSRLVRFMDHVFLQVLRANERLAPEIFLRLFENVPRHRLLRFLSDSPTLLDALHIVAALPKWPFLRACLRISNNN